MIIRQDISGQTCSKTFNEGFVISEPVAMTFTATAFDETGCSDDPTGKINVTVNGGTAPYFIKLYGEGSTPRVVSTASGDYTFVNLEGSSVGHIYQIEVLDAAGCMATNGGKYQQSLTIPNHSLMSINNLCQVLNLVFKSVMSNSMLLAVSPITSVTNNYRINVTKQSVAVLFDVETDATGAIVDIIKSQLSDDVTSDVNKVKVGKLLAGEYNITVLDKNALPANCTVSDNISVSQLQATFVSVQPSCESLSNGSLTLNVVGAVGSELEYTWFYNESSFTTLDNDATTPNIYKTAPTTTDASFADWNSANKLLLSDCV